MAKYILEVITPHGNPLHDFNGTLTEARIEACRYAFGVHKRYPNYNYVNIYEPAKFGLGKHIESIFYDPVVSAQYTDLRPGFYLQKRGKNHRRYRVSPKTGRLLDVSKTWKYL